MAVAPGSEAAAADVRRASGGGGGGASGGAGPLARLFRSPRTRRNDAAIEQLLSMGFDAAQAEEAVAQVGPDPNRAVDYILGDHAVDADDDAEDVGDAMAGAAVSGAEQVRRQPGGGLGAAFVGAEAAEALIRALDSPDQSGRLRSLFESLQHEQDGGDVQWGQLLQVLLSRVQPAERNDGVTEEQVSAALPETVMTEELLSTHGDDGGECACPLCMESIALGDRVAVLPCGHVYHRSPALPTESELPKVVTVDGHDCTLVNFEQLSYSAWICDVCLRNQGKRGTFFHDGPIGTPNDNGFDCCVRCAQKHAVLGEDMASVCGGIDAWLMTTPNCPTCRASVFPKPTQVAPPPQHVVAQAPGNDSSDGDALPETGAEMAGAPGQHDMADIDVD